MSYMISPEAIGLQARRLRIVCEIKGERLREELAKLEDLLVTEITKKDSTRSRTAERAMVHSNLRVYTERTSNSNVI
jgi:hypothetical protein